MEEKDLLLRDLCCRLPYGVIMSTPIGDGHLNSMGVRVKTKVVWEGY